MMAISALSAEEVDLPGPLLVHVPVQVTRVGTTYNMCLHVHVFVDADDNGGWPCVG